MSADTSAREESTGSTRPPPSPAATYTARPGRASRQRLSTGAAAGFLGPNLILLGVFLFLPLGWAFLISFQESSGFGASGWVGLENYRRLVTDPTFWQSALNTAAFTLITVPSSLALGLGLAVLMNSVLPGRRLFRTLIYLPMVISGIATALMGVLLFDEATGIVNKLLRESGLATVPWQSQGTAAFASVILVTLWIRVGFNMVIYLAGLQGISPELYEAARLEGASSWQQFRYLTVPLVGPSTFFLLIMDVIYSFQVFDTIFVMTGGGPGRSTSVLVTYAYENGFVTRDQSYAAAIGIVIFLITLVFTAIQWRGNRSRDTVG
ncbi:carbohydrate ABC transporter permease [Arthrobacter agilis]|uniref:carbohydrate ABC transporter permease n=1 Tax=Arthrobacter agilis TaxID=37921 RepID=UPI002783A6FA|nr:sugar ABC transporter permease [Arthrobacter agilis]MDQ0733877.1 multiple sugar transport system permease protein [Arthrobacter agilis]